MLGKAEPSIFSFTDRHGREIGDYSQDVPVVDDDGSVVVYDYVGDVLPVVESQDDNEIPGVPEESPVEPTGVEVDPEHVPNETNFDLHRKDSNRILKKRPTSGKPRASQPAIPPQRLCWTLHRLA